MKPAADRIALAGLRLLVMVADVRAVCVVANCTLCHNVFNPLGGPCGSVVCPRCLREWLPSDTISCSRCGPSQRDMCPVSRSAAQDRAVPSHAAAWRS
jgi:hypothetical protein